MLFVIVFLNGIFKVDEGLAKGKMRNHESGINGLMIPNRKRRVRLPQFQGSDRFILRVMEIQERREEDFSFFAMNEIDRGISNPPILIGLQQIKIFAFE